MKNLLENYLLFLEEDSPIKISVDKGDMEIPEGKHMENTPINHFQRMIMKDGWNKVSKRITTLRIFNKNKNPKFSLKMEKLQNDLANWVEDKRKNNPNFGK